MPATNDEPAIVETDFKPGTLIKIKNIKSRPELNGRSGVVDGKRRDNGRFPIMCDGEKVLCLKYDCIEVVHQCPNEEHVFENGMLPIIWPHVKGVPTPTIEWLFDDFYLRTDEIDVFDQKCDETLAWKKFGHRLQQRMNWANLQCLGFEMTNDAKTVKGKTKMLMFYERTSKQRVNDWLDYLLPISTWRNARKQLTMRGPIVFMCQFSKAQNERSSNSMKQRLYGTRYHPDDYLHFSEETYIDYTQERTNNERINYRYHKLNGIFTKNSICPKHLRCIYCIKFEVQHKTYEREVKKVAKQLDLSKREAASNVHNSSGVGSHLQRLCEDQGVEVEDFWSTAIMRRTQSCPIMRCLQEMNVHGTSRNHADNVLNDTVYEIIRKEFNRTNRIPISPEVSNDCKFEF